MQRRAGNTQENKRRECKEEKEKAKAKTKVNDVSSAERREMKKRGER
jgi:hypothetical protein